VSWGFKGSDLMRAIAAAVLLIVALNASAEATQCRPAEINGNWSAYLSYGDDSGIWTECRFTIRNRRVLSGRCQQPEFGWFPVAGALSLSRSCALSGYVAENGCCFNQTIFGALQSNGQAGSGIMTNRPGAPLEKPGSLFTLVRRP
jgi:hypothetical protein